MVTICIINLQFTPVVDCKMLPVKGFSQAIFIPQYNVDSVGGRWWSYITRQIGQHSRNWLDPRDGNCKREKKMGKMQQNRIFASWNTAIPIRIFGPWPVRQKYLARSGRTGKCPVRFVHYSIGERFHIFGENIYPCRLLRFKNIFKISLG